MNGFPEYVDLEFSARCNLRCGFCFGPVDDRSVVDLDVRFWKSVIRAVYARGCTWIVVSGGEPTLYRGLGQLLQFAEDLGLRTVLSTHGRLTERVIAVAPYCDWIALPVDGHSPAATRALRGDAWGIREASVLAHRLKLLPGVAVRIKLGSVATCTNRNELWELAKALDAMTGIPFDTWKIYQYTPRRKFADRHEQYEISDDDYVRLALQIESTGITRKLNTVFSSNASRRQAYLFVYPDGKVSLPNQGNDFSDRVLGNFAREGESVLDRVTAPDVAGNRINFERTYR